MITYALLNILVLLVNAVSWLVSLGGNDASISGIPVIGDVLYTTLSTVSKYWVLARDIVPYMNDVWLVFSLVIIPFELALLVAKVILGSRAPVKE